MQYYRLADGQEYRLAVQTENGVYDLTSVESGLASYIDVVRLADTMNVGIDNVTAQLVERADELSKSVLKEAVQPLVPEEVWAAGVTYQISEEAREEESSMPDLYLDVYESERPELFFKATPSRTVGPLDAVGIRGDSTWDVPEPELGIALHQGDIVGYTIGNDVSSRSIEGENPLFLPQAKVYDRCCSIGPCIASTDSIDDPHTLEMSMTITRDNEVVYQATTNTGEMVRTCEELVEYFVNHNNVPETAVLLTGTSLVPDDDFTLRRNDDIEIEIEDIGVLENSVTVV